TATSSHAPIAAKESLAATARFGAATVPATSLLADMELTLIPVVVFIRTPRQAQAAPILLKCLEPGGAKPADRRINNLARRWLGVLELVIHIQFLPFETAHLMKGQHVHPLDIS